MELTRAQKLAEKIKEELAPYCEQIEITGSIRRARPNVNDIDLVLLPKPNQLNALRNRIFEKTRPITAGQDNIITALRLPMGKEFQLDIFVARPASRDLFQETPTNWGTLLLCRTGSKEHNIWIAQRALARGMKWNPYYGLFGKDPKTGRSDTCLASATEQEIFTALDLEFIPPERRER